MLNSISTITSPQFGDIRVIGSPTPTEFCLVDVCRALDTETRAAEKWLSKENITKVNTKDRAGRRTRPIRFINVRGLDDIIAGSGKQEARNLKSSILGNVDEKDDDWEIDHFTGTDKYSRMFTEVNNLLCLISSKLYELKHQNEQLNEENRKLKDGKDFVSSQTTYTTTEIAKDFGYSASVLNGMLKIVGVQYYKSGIWILKSPYSSWGLTQLRTGNYETKDGNPGSRKLTVWTEKGRRFLTALRQHGFDCKATVNSLKREFNL